MQDEKTIGLNAVRVAARLCEAVRAEMIAAGQIGRFDKQDKSPVTIADFGAQAIVCRLLADAFPDDVIVAEEDSAALQTPENANQLSAVTRFVREQIDRADERSVCEWIDQGNGEPGGRYWTLDPIDGTKGFLRNEQYAVALALIERGVVQWGFLACPALPYQEQKGIIVMARRGAGAQAFTLDGTALGTVRVSDIKDVRQARLLESVESSHSDQGLTAQLRQRAGIAAESVRMDSQAKYAAISGGQAEIYLRFPSPRTPDYRENIWDHAAGSLIVEEAGGRVTDVYGRVLDWTQGRRLLKNIGVVATNGLLHDAVLKALAPLVGAASD